MLAERVREGGTLVLNADDEESAALADCLHALGQESPRWSGFQRIWLCVTPRNRAAIRSYEKVGFRFLPETIYSPEAEMELEL